MQKNIEFLLAVNTSVEEKASENISQSTLEKSTDVQKVNLLTNEPVGKTEEVEKVNILTGEKIEKTPLSLSLKQENTNPPVHDYSLSSSYFSAIGMLVFMLVLLYLILWAMKKFGKGKYIPFATSIKRDDLRVEARVPLDGKKTLYVVKYMNKRLLVGGSDQAITLLSEEDYYESELNTDEKTNKPDNQDNQDKSENSINTASRQDFKETVQLFNNEMNKN